MNRTRFAVSLGIVLMGLFLLAAKPIEGGCHGGCIRPPICIPTPTPDFDGDASAVATIATVIAGDADPLTTRWDTNQIATVATEIAPDEEGTPVASPISYFLGEAMMGPDPSTGDDNSPANLELYRIPIPVGGESNSLIWAGDATAFTVSSGVVTFTLVVEQGFEPATVRTQPPTEATVGTDGYRYVVVAGGNLFVDAQAGALAVKYKNDANEDAEILIASAVPDWATPPPDC